ncbi:hypothetical protein ACF0H5_020447 [Mactra antiquata]
MKLIICTALLVTACGATSFDGNGKGITGLGENGGYGGISGLGENGGFGGITGNALQLMANALSHNGEYQIPGLVALGDGFYILPGIGLIRSRELSKVHS